MVFTGPIFDKPCMADEVTAGMPAAFFLGFFNFKRTLSGGVRARGS